MTDIMGAGETAERAGAETIGGGGPAALAITRLSLSAFRSYPQAQLDLDDRPVVLIGPNGAGKTNVLEALSLLAPGRGLRAARIADLRHVASLVGAGKPVSGAPGNGEVGPGAPKPGAPKPGADVPKDWAVAVTLRQGAEDYRIGTGSASGDRRVVRINGAPASGAGELSALLRLAWLTPAMDRLFVEGPAERRKFLDRLVLGDAPAHASHAAAYERAMRTRNRLLTEGRLDPVWLDGVEDQMAEHGAAMLAARRHFLTRLRGAIDAWDDTGPHAEAFPRADIALEGPWEPLMEGPCEGEAREIAARRLRDGRSRDAAAGRTLEGPHRSDLLVAHRAKAMPARDCSTGEQKALLIGLVLANARLRAAEDGRPPLLLLDEVAAHLDGLRRAALFDELCRLRVQAWMTGTDAVLFEAFGDRVQRVTVEQSCFKTGESA